MTQASNLTDPHVWNTEKTLGGMLKKTVQQGRSRRKHRRRSLWATLRMLSRRERSWRFFSASRGLRAFLPGPHPPRRNHSIHTLNGFDYLIDVVGI